MPQDLLLAPAGPLQPAPQEVLLLARAGRGRGLCGAGSCVGFRLVLGPPCARADTSRNAQCAFRDELSVTRRSTSRRTIADGSRSSAHSPVRAPGVRVVAAPWATGATWTTRRCTRSATAAGVIPTPPSGAIVARAAPPAPDVTTPFGRRRRPWRAQGRRRPRPNTARRPLRRSPRACPSVRSAPARSPSPAPRGCPR